LGQYRRFIEDVPRGQPQVLDEAQFLAWGARYLASDATSARRAPPSVITPSGPLADIGALWSGQALYDPGRIMAPTLLVRGAWDALCTDADADQLLGVMASRHKLDARSSAAPICCTWSRSARRCTPASTCFCKES